MTLRPALFDLWPKPWPEDCQHVWHLSWAMLNYDSYHCNGCNTDLTKQWNESFPTTPNPTRKTP